jgi:hypothetical protein
LEVGVNPIVLTEVLLERAESSHEDLESKIDGPEALYDAMYEINSRRDVEFPDENAPEGLTELVESLRTHFKDDVSKISLLLSFFYPEDFLYYRVCPFEPEIFEGLAFLSQVAPELELPFDRVGRRGFERYLELNQALRIFSERCWPDVDDPASRIYWLLYRGLAPLFATPSGYRRYWIMATREEYWPHLDEGGDLYWAGRKEMEPGDLVFFYRTAPRKAITDIYEVAPSGVTIDPWGSWHGLWFDLEKVTAIPDIPFSKLRTDPVLGKWGVIRRQFQGVVSEPVTHAVYNRLLELLPEDLCEEHGLEPEELAATGSSGSFASEEEFEDAVVEPLVRRMGLGMERQHVCTFQIGSQATRGRVDFLLKDGDRPVALIENKLKIVNDAQLQTAVAQARSYALQLGLPTFLIGAPEGLWLYRLELNRESLVDHWTGDGVDADELRRLLLAG